MALWNSADVRSLQRSALRACESILVTAEAQVDALKNELETNPVATSRREQVTVVFPAAECQFYFTADPWKRAARRGRELQEQGRNVSLEDLTAEIRARDLRDATREVAPLKCAADAIRVDTSHRTIDEVLDLLEETARRKLAERK